MKILDAARAQQTVIQSAALANAANAAVKWEIKDMQLPAITIESESDKVRIPKLGENLEDGKQDHN